MMWRYEIKFRIPGHLADQANHMILGLPFLRRSFPKRRVNSAYFDTPDAQAALDNLAGVSDRTKHRLRWYGDAEKFDRSIYELKIRNGRLGSKQAFESGVANLSNLPASTQSWPVTHSNEALRRLLASAPTLSPVLMVSYERDYFVGQDGIRLTVDQDLIFRDMRQGVPKVARPLDDGLMIVEVKFPPTARNAARDFVQSLPFRPMRNSKYVLGLSCLGQSVYL